ncbi:hypothetical protein [Salmonella enterica]|uniref:hypothetical protein n=1 Tax=Salmonella enterica TaxID=28901 RepID=UPI002FF83B8B
MKDEFKGTKGQWQVLPEEVDKPYIRIRGTIPGHRYKVANVLIPVYEGVHAREADETRANAKLIAAAPELLEALRQLRDYVEDVCDDCHEEHPLNLANKAIKKALGNKQ